MDIAFYQRLCIEALNAKRDLTGLLTGHSNSLQTTPEQRDAEGPGRLERLQ